MESKYDPDEFFHHKRPGLVESRYISPIQITLGQIQYRFDDGVYRATINAGIKVDKAELIKALNYDRAQYAQGYADGLMERPFAKGTNVRSNADRSRQMSNEELAERFASACPPKDATNRCCQYYLQGSNGCKDCWIDWLQKEVEE